MPHKQLTLQAPHEFGSLAPPAPLLTSLATPWQTISMSCMNLPAFELPEFCTPSLHCINIFTTSNKAERTLDGVSKADSHQIGDIIIIPVNVSVGVRWMSQGNMISVGLDPALFTSAIEDASNFKQTQLLPHFATPDPLVYQLGLSLKAMLEQNPTGSRLYAETAAAMLSVHLLQHYGQQKLEFKDYTDGLPRSTLDQVINYIDTNLNRELGLAELATIACLSPHYFTRLFKQSTGYTPHQFVIHCRVKRAKILLLDGKDSIADIAQQVGFASQAHLSLHIKRSLGVTPKMLLKQRKNR